MSDFGMFLHKELMNVLEQRDMYIEERLFELLREKGFIPKNDEKYLKKAVKKLSKMGYYLDTIDEITTNDETIIVKTKVLLKRYDDET